MKNGSRRSATSNSTPRSEEIKSRKSFPVGYPQRMATTDDATTRQSARSPGPAPRLSPPPPPWLLDAFGACPPPCPCPAIDSSLKIGMESTYRIHFVKKSSQPLENSGKPPVSGVIFSALFHHAERNSFRSGRCGFRSIRRIFPSKAFPPEGVRVLFRRVRRETLRGRLQLRP